MSKISEAIRATVEALDKAQTLDKAKLAVTLALTEAERIKRALPKTKP